MLNKPAEVSSAAAAEETKSEETPADGTYTLGSKEKDDKRSVRNVTLRRLMPNTQGKTIDEIK